MDAAGTTPLSELPAAEIAPVRPAEADDPVGAVLAAREAGRPLALHTSGTTGFGRTVLRTTQSWWSSFPAYAALSGVEAGARVWAPGPLTATMTLFAAVHARVQGASLVSSPGEATHACLTPAQLDRRGSELRAGTRVVVAGDRLPAAVAARAADHGLGIAHYYGAAELSFVAAGGDALRAFPGVDIEVRAGVIWVRSPYLCSSVDPPGSLLRDEHGWATVGDRGRLDDGVLLVDGRPDAVTTAGATVVLGELESALASIARAPLAVVGLPHPTLGTVVTVVLTDPDDRAGLQGWTRANLPASHRPRRWAHRPELPLTGAGKVDRAALVAEVAASDERPGTDR